jgi:hypothetical protein
MSDELAVMSASRPDECHDFVVIADQVVDLSAKVRTT